ncbi:hypothetical protein T35B1_11071 [Salinisphaera shabanensis T35B1]|jgi:hypothetical protein|uniref:Inner membrane protein n=1 Tax=Salinisphaera shabanensis E1L3A TaxID=1033802 RepID=U2E2Y2_9GAMM|nr:hypothetical protein [Salinisphaera shabanensis]ERJ18246.1 Putative inner membrane protein [Salinisphaera shabanensis E1L3A]
MKNTTYYKRDTRRRIHVWGATLWPAFLVAGIGSIVFFANIDPATLRMQTLPDMQLNREAGYAIGFLMFWAIGVASSALTTLLLRRPRTPRPDPTPRDTK